MRAVVTAPENFQIAVRRVVKGMMGALDRDGNGSLSEEEYLRMYTTFGLAPDTCAEAFKRLDRNGNGQISLDEFNQALDEFYLGGDPNAPGNWLLGPMDEL